MSNQLWGDFKRHGLCDNIAVMAKMPGIEQKLLFRLIEAYEIHRVTHWNARYHIRIDSRRFHLLDTLWVLVMLSLTFNSVFGQTSVTNTRVFTGHSGALHALAIQLPFTYTSSTDYTVKQWYIYNGSSATTFSGYGSPVYAVAVSPSYLFAAGDSPYKIMQWSLSNATLMLTLSSAHTASIRSLFVVGKYLFSGGDDLFIKQWTIGLNTASFWTSNTGINVYTVTASSRLIFTAGNPFTIYSWLMATNAPDFSYVGHSNTIQAIVTQGSWLYSASLDKNVIQWSTKNGSSTATWVAPLALYSLTVSSNYVFAGAASYVYQWSITNSSALLCLYIASGTINFLQFDNYFLFGAGSNNLMYQWTISGMAPISVATPFKTLSGHSGNVRRIAIQSPFILSSSNDNNIKQWYMANASIMYTYPGYSYALAVTSIYWFGVGSTGGNKIYQWSLVNNTQLNNFVASTGQILAIAVTSESLFSISVDGQIKQWALSTKTLVWSAACAVNTNFVYASADLYFTALSSSSIGSWFLSNNTAGVMFTGHANGISNVVAKDFIFIFSAGYDGFIVQWTVQNGSSMFWYDLTNIELSSLAIQNNYVFAAGQSTPFGVYQLSIGNNSIYAAYSTSASVDSLIYTNGFLYGALWDNTIRQWSALNTIPAAVPAAATFTGHSNIVQSIAIWTPYLYSASSDNSIKQWYISNVSITATFSNYNARINSVVVYSGLYLYAGGDAQNIMQLAVNGTYMGTLYPGYTKTITSLSIQGQHLYSVSADGIVKQWAVGNATSSLTLQSNAAALDASSIIATSTTVFTTGPNYIIVSWFLANVSASFTYRSHAGVINDLVFQDGYLFSSSQDGTVVQWTIANGSAVYWYYPALPLASVATTAFFVFASTNSDGVSTGGSVFQWSALNGTLYMTYSGGGYFSHVLIFGAYMFASSWDSQIYEWNVMGVIVPAISGGQGLAGHSNAVQDIAVQLPFLYSCSSDGTVKQWSVGNLTNCYTFIGYGNSLNGLDVSSSYLIAAGASPFNILQWSLSNYSLIAMVTGAHAQIIMDVSIQGRFVYSVGQDFLLKQWLIGSNSSTSTVWGVNYGAVANFVLTTATNIYVGGNSNRINSWFLSNNSGSWVFGTSGAVTFLASYDVYLYASCSDGFVVQYYTTNGSSYYWYYVGFTLNSVAANGQFVFAGASNVPYCVYQWSWANTSLYATYPHSASVNALVTQSGYLYSASSDNITYQWGIMGNVVLPISPMRTFAGHVANVLVISVNFPYTYTCSSDGTVKKWYINNGSIAFNYGNYGGSVYAMAVSTLYVYAAGDTPYQIVQWALTNNSVTLTIAFAHSQSIYAISIQGGSLYSSGADGFIKRWLVNGSGSASTPLWTSGAVTSYPAMLTNTVVTSAAYTFASGALYSILSWFASNNSARFTYSGHANQVTGLAIQGGFLFSSSLDKFCVQWSITNSSSVYWYFAGDFLFSVQATVSHVFAGTYGTPGTIYQWSYMNITAYASYTGMGNSVNYIQVQGAFLFAASVDAVCYQWSISGMAAPTGSMLQMMTGHSDSVQSITVQLPYLISGSLDGTVKVWSNAGGNYSAVATWTSSSGPVYAIASMQGFVFAAGNSPFTISQWSLSSNSAVASFSGHTQRILGLCVLGNFLFSVGQDSVLYKWDIFATTSTTVDSFIGSGQAVAASSDFVVVGTSTPLLLSWYLANSSNAFKFAGHISSINALSIQDSFLFSAASDGYAIQWALYNGSSVFWYYSGSLALTSITVNRLYVFAGSSAPPTYWVHQWSWGNQSLYQVYPHNNVVNSLFLQYSSLFAGSADGTIKQWVAVGFTLTTTSTTSTTTSSTTTTSVSTTTFSTSTTETASSTTTTTTMVAEPMAASKGIWSSIVIISVAAGGGVLVCGAAAAALMVNSANKRNGRGRRRREVESGSATFNKLEALHV